MQILKVNSEENRQHDNDPTVGIYLQQIQRRREGDHYFIFLMTMFRCQSYHRHCCRRKISVLLQEVIPFVSRRFFSGYALSNVGEDGGGRRDIRRSKMVHPWPEWVEFLERLVKKGYADDSDGFYCDHNQIRTSCLMFARDHFSLYGYFFF